MPDLFQKQYETIASSKNEWLKHVHYFIQIMIPPLDCFEHIIVGYCTNVFPAFPAVDSSVSSTSFATESKGAAYSTSW